MHFGKTPSKELLYKSLTFIFFVLICFWSIKPAFTHIGTSLPGGGDIYLIDWILNQNIQKIPYHLNNIFQGNFYYPFKDSMLFADLLLPSSILAFIPVVITHLPAVAYNLNLIVGQLALLVVGYLWFYELGRDRLVSLVGITVLAMSQIRMNFVGYLQMWVSTWWLIACWMIWRFFKTGKTEFLLIGSLFAVIQFWESPFFIFYILFFLFMFVFANRDKIRRKNTKKYGLATTFFLIGSLPIVYKYFLVSEEYAVTRSIREAAHFAMSLNDIWGYLFAPGLLSLLLISILVIRKSFLKNRDILWISWLGLTAFIMSLGPVLKVNDATFKIAGKFFVPLPYGIFYYIIPGFKGLRTPVRWIWLFAFCISALFVVVFSKYKSKYKNALLAGLLVIGVLGGTRMNYFIDVPKPENYPQVYKTVKNLSGNVIIELPIYTWGAGEPFQHEFEREFFGIYHGKRTVNGASGLNPPKWEELQASLWKNFPNDESTNILSSIGIDYIIVHKNEYQTDKLADIVRWGSDKLLWQDDMNAIYALK